MHVEQALHTHWTSLALLQRGFAASGIEDDRDDEDEEGAVGCVAGADNTPCRNALLAFALSLAEVLDLTRTAFDPLSLAAFLSSALPLADDAAMTEVTGAGMDPTKRMLPRSRTATRRKVSIYVEGMR